MTAYLSECDWIIAIKTNTFKQYVTDAEIRNSSLLYIKQCNKNVYVWEDSDIEGKFICCVKTKAESLMRHSWAQEGSSYL